ncbi:MAG: hypothetical protein QGG36_10125 [Pirellulaceae bacterium]|jgi:hypothetical protein|nr:hypothetical protein [Pirellulaceae bacterium]
MQYGWLRTSALVAAMLFAATGQAANKWGLKPGAVKLRSAGALTFAADGILLIGDTKAATIYAVATGDTKGDSSSARAAVESLGAKVADALEQKAADIKINDLAVNPLSGNAYLSIGTQDGGAIVKVDGKGKVSELPLEKIEHSKVTLPNAPEDKVVRRGRRSRNARDESITDLAFADGKVLVSGLTNAESPSSVREVPFPFTDATAGTAIEIYHGAHGRLEDYAAVRAFVPFTINGEPSLLAGFTCTPLVKFPLKDLAAGKSVRGTTVAELGNRNRPLDMIVYKKDGASYVLMANSARGVMKISTKGLDTNKGITERVGGGGTAGQTYETIADLKGVVQLDKLGDDRAVVIVQSEDGQNLKVVSLP